MEHHQAKAGTRKREGQSHHMSPERLWLKKNTHSQSGGSDYDTDFSGTLRPKVGQCHGYTLQSNDIALKGRLRIQNRDKSSCLKTLVASDDLVRKTNPNVLHYKQNDLKQSHARTALDF